MNKLSNTVKYTLFLVVLGVVAAGLLAVVNSFTAPIIEEAKQRKLQETLEKDFPYPSYEETKFSNLSKEITNVYYGLDSEGALKTVIYRTDVHGFAGPVVTLIGISAQTNKILKVVVIDVPKETKGIGSELIGHDFKVSGRDTANFSYEKYGEGRGGATVSSNAAGAGIDAAVQHYLSIKDTLTNISTETDIVYTFVNSGQDFETFNFVYTITVDDQEVQVVTNKNNEILSVSNNELDTEDHRKKYNEIISSNKVTAYVDSATEADGVVTLLIKSKGYSKTILETTVTIAENRIETFTTDLSSQSYDDEYNDQWSGVDPDTLFPEVVEKQDNLDSVEAISGATISSKGIINAAKVAKAYIEEVLINE